MKGASRFTNTTKTTRRVLLVLACLFLVAAGIGLRIPTHRMIPKTLTQAQLPKALPVNADDQLQLLADYQKEVGVNAQMMDFIGFPQTTEEANTLAAQLAVVLQHWHQAGIKPLVIMEPTFNGGQTLMSLSAFQAGDYDAALTSFFSDLASFGVSDQEMGTWVPLPEPNDPGWADNVANPQLFVENFSKVAKVIKTDFPKTPVSILLDSQTSQKADYSDATMAPSALLPYLAFEPGLISSFGLQGFSWNNNDSPAAYLSSAAAIIGAHALGVKNIWFNTGTYSRVNSTDGQGILTASNKRRSQLLSEVLEQTIATQKAGLNVDFINIFGYDNFQSSSSGTGTAEFNYDSPQALQVLKDFVATAKQQQTAVSIFDAPAN